MELKVPTFMVNVDGVYSDFFVLYSFVKIQMQMFLTYVRSSPFCGFSYLQEKTKNMLSYCMLQG